MTTAAQPSPSANAYRYVGEYGYYRDSAAVQYVRARYLNVLQGRWMSADPLRFEAGDYNLYRYVGNEPVGRMDASIIDGRDGDKCRDMITAEGVLYTTRRTCSLPGR